MASVRAGQPPKVSISQRRHRAHRWYHSSVGNILPDQLDARGALSDGERSSNHNTRANETRPATSIKPNISK